MEQFKSFNDIAKEMNIAAEPFDTSFLDDFDAYMQESVRQSERNSLLAIESASKVFINL